LVVLVIEFVSMYGELRILISVLFLLFKVELFFLFRLFWVLVWALVVTPAFQKRSLVIAVSVVWVSYSGCVIDIRSIELLFWKDCFMVLAIVIWRDYCIAIVSVFILFFIMVSTASMRVIWKSLSSCWNFFLKSCSICSLFAAMGL